jgi:hypothetical protein
MCNRHGPVATWLTTEWPGNLTPFPKTLCVLGAHGLPQCNAGLLYQPARTVDETEGTPHRELGFILVKSPANCVAIFLKHIENFCCCMHCTSLLPTGVFAQQESVKNILYMKYRHHNFIFLIRCWLKVHINLIDQDLTFLYWFMQFA